MNTLFYTSLLSFMCGLGQESDLVRFFHQSDKASYCAPVISNGTLYTQLDISGTQRQDVRYNYHGPKGSPNDMIPGVYFAGRRYNNIQRTLIPFGHFEEQKSIGKEVLGAAKEAGQILDLGRGSSACRNDYAGGLSIYTHAFVHKTLPIMAVRKKFTGKPENFSYRFDYFYAEEGVARTPVRWSNYSIDRLPDNRGAVIRYRVDGMQDLSGSITLLSSGVPQKIEIEGCRVSFVYENVPETVDFTMIYTDSLNENDWQKEQKTLVERAEKEKFDGLFASHSRAWKELWGRFVLDIPDKKMQDVFYGAVYNLVCTSTPWSIPVGVHPYSWQGKYFSFNLFVSLFCTLNSRPEALKVPAFRRSTMENAIARTTNWVYSAGARFPWLSDEEGLFECSAPGVWQDHIFHMGNISLEAWEYFRYTRDMEYLKNTAYPVIRKCAEFFLRQSVYTVADGRVIVGKCCDLERLGTARENAFLTTCSVICALEIAAEVSELLNEDPQMRSQWKETTRKLRESLPNDGKKYLPFHGCEEKSIGVFGGLYPYFVLDPADPLQKAAVNDYLGSTAEAGNMYPFGKNICTWYAAWVANGMIRLGNSARAVEYLQKASLSTGAFGIIYEINEPGAFVSHPWCSAPPACYIQGVLELLCRSEKDTVILCRDLENIWKDLRFTLGAPDDLTIALEMKNGKAAFLKVTAGKAYSGQIRKVEVTGKTIKLEIKADESKILIGKE